MIAFGTILVLLALSAPATAFQGKGKGPDKTDKADYSFGRDQERIIREWFSRPSNLQGLPPGLAKRDRLPPGLEKQLVRNGTLPPGLQKRVQPLPRDLEILLPRLPDGWRRILLGRDVILQEDRTSRILDILRNVF
jgi:hypothetical protein